MPFSPGRPLLSSTDASNGVVVVIQANLTGRFFVWLYGRGGRFITQDELAVQWHGSAKLLRLVDGLLRQKKIMLKDIVGIIVVRGPGPFTAVRTGLIVANTLGMLLDIPVRGIVADRLLDRKKIQSLITQKQRPATVIKPWYGRKPNITMPHKKATR